MIFNLLEELIARIEQMRHSIRMEVLHERVNQTFQQKTEEKLKCIKFEVQELLRSEERLLLFVNPQLYTQYRLKCDILNQIEYHGVQVLKKYGDTEIYFSSLLKELIQKQFRLNISAPMVTTIKSNKDYFWADIERELIGIPSGEEHHLTSLPDLVHEISHFIIAYDSANKWVIGNIHSKIEEYFNEALFEIEDNTRRPRSLLIDIPKWKDYWNNKWIIEFACDMLATYFVGSAYAWTNLKIAMADLPKDIYNIEKDEHPSHEARMRAINEMLRMIGCESEIESINLAWGSLLTLPSHTKPDNYRLVFPDILLQNLAYNIYNGCQNYGYLSYTQQLLKIESPISELMNRAWDALLNKPSEYQVWEKEQVKELHKRFNFQSSDVQNT
jgi:hypothetical protein